MNELTFRITFLAPEAHHYCHCTPVATLAEAEAEAAELRKSGCVVWINDELWRAPRKTK